MGEQIHRGDENRIIEYPDNYHEMLTKLAARDKDQVQSVLDKHRAGTVEELRNIASKTIAERQQRLSTEHKPLKDRNILKNPKSPEVAELKEKLSKEIQYLAHQVLSQLPDQLSSLKGKLQGRIKPDGGGDAVPSA